MPFPFLPAGLVLAAAVLGAAYAAFTMILRALDRAALTTRNSIAPGIVAGFRTWSSGGPPERRTSSPVGADRALGAFPAAGVGPSASAGRPLPAAADTSGGEMVELDEEQGVPLESVHRR